MLKPVAVYLARPSPSCKFNDNAKIKRPRVTRRSFLYHVDLRRRVSSEKKNHDANGGAKKYILRFSLDVCLKIRQFSKFSKKVILID